LKVCKVLFATGSLPSIEHHVGFICNSNNLALGFSTISHRGQYFSSN